METLVREQRRRAATLDHHQHALEMVVQRMYRDPGSPLDLAAMAGIARVSRFHFDRLFRTATGVSPRHFQTAVRLHAAARLVLTTARSVTDVCFDVGYESLGTFVATFTRTFGLSPQRLREAAVAMAAPWPSTMMSALAAEFGMQATAPLVHGRALLDAPFQGIIFIGLFSHAIPVRAPLACTILPKPGAFALGPAPDVPAYLFGVAMPACDTPLAFLLNDATLRGGGQLVPPNAAHDFALTLRLPRPLDPPMNIALPYLIAEKVATIAAR